MIKFWMVSMSSQSWVHVVVVNYGSFRWELRITNNWCNIFTQFEQVWWEIILSIWVIFLKWQENNLFFIQMENQDDWLPVVLNSVLLYFIFQGKSITTENVLLFVGYKCLRFSWVCKPWNKVANEKEISHSFSLLWF